MKLNRSEDVKGAVVAGGLSQSGTAAISLALIGLLGSPEAAVAHQREVAQSVSALRTIAAQQPHAETGYLLKAGLNDAKYSLDVCGTSFGRCFCKVAGCQLRTNSTINEKL